MEVDKLYPFVLLIILTGMLLGVGILVLDKGSEKEEETDCVRCSRCIEACPSGLMPCMIAQGMKFNRIDISKEYDPLDCIECGSCSYVCPSRIDIVQFIKLAKLKARGNK